MSVCDMAVGLERLEGDRFFPGQEQQFKMETQRAYRQPGLTVFEIENEEKEPGFPDTLEIKIDRAIRRGPYGCARPEWVEFVEYKVSDSRGYIEFRKDQPLFYKRHSDLRIMVRAWSVPDQRGYIFGANEILQACQHRATEGDNPMSVCIKGGILK